MDEKYIQKNALKVKPIKNGTVIDHIPEGLALRVLYIVGIPDPYGNIATLAMNVKSKNGKKDIVKVENRELERYEVNQIALIASKATINIIRDFEVVDKYQVELPNEIIGLVKCSNLTCISNSNEPIKSRFEVIEKYPPRIKCHYCDREPEDIYSCLNLNSEIK